MENQNKELSEVVIQPDGSTATPTGGPNQISPINPSEPWVVMMTMNRRLSIFFRLKLLTVLLATIVLGVGSHAYFNSPSNNIYGPSESVSRVLETFFISIIIITSGISIANLMFTFDADYKSGNNKWETVYHALAGIFLFLAGIVNIASAEMKFTDQYLVHYNNNYNNRGSGSGSRPERFLRNGQQFYDAKIAAGSFALVNACLYFHTAKFVNKLND